MPLTNAARNLIAELLIGDTSNPPFDFDHAYMAIGDSNAGFNADQTTLESELTNGRKQVAIGYPTIDGNIMTFRVSFTSTYANGTWREWGIFNAPAAGIMLNRLVLGTSNVKSGATWAVTVELEVVGA